MAWLAPAVGFIDSKATLRCTDCAEEWQRETPVWGDQWFTQDDKCDDCGKQLEHIPSSGYVHHD